MGCGCGYAQSYPQSGNSLGSLGRIPRQPVLTDDTQRRSGIGDPRSMLANPEPSRSVGDHPADRSWRVRVAVDAPLRGALDYLWGQPLAPGTLVRVPLGRQVVCAVVLHCDREASDAGSRPLKSVEQVLDCLQPLSAQWMDLLGFAADYYQRPLGELMGAALPGWLRENPAQAVRRRVQQALRRDTRYMLSDLGRRQLASRLRRHGPALVRLARALGLEPPEADGAADPPAVRPAAGPQAPGPAAAAGLDEADARRLHPRGAALLREWLQRGWLLAGGPAPPPAPAELPVLRDEQAAAVQALAQQQGFGAQLLFGVTGSGKTEVYLRVMQQVLERDPQAQVLVLTPEINLTPQLLRRLAARFPGQRLALLHSGLAQAERFDHWAAAHHAQARIVLGTRLAVLASLPRLALIVVDEEHDPSYKQQEGARYSARDLAVWRARQLGVAVLLGSATPSLESWHAASRGRYGLLRLQQRSGGELPRVRLLSSREDPLLRAGGPVGQALFDAVTQRLQLGQQCLMFLNRRGYAPVLCCPDCGWMSDCAHCDSHLVYHRSDRSLRCHHCGYRQPVARACPHCGGLDLQPVGRGTQRVEEALEGLFPRARIARIDADTAARKGQAEVSFSQVHAGEVDILVGTQMITKGHDFQRVGLVAALNPDAGLFSHDPRAPERLFAQLVQAAGRAGRAGGAALQPEMLVQTAYPEHPLYQALQRNDYAGFAERELGERKRAAMPPFSFQALLRAEHANPDKLQEFIDHAAQLAQGLAAGGQPTVYPPVPSSLARLAGVHRQQILVESARRAALHGFLRDWRQALQDTRGGVRWAIDVDPTDF